MSQEAWATFQCGMANPWTPWNPRPWPESPVVYNVPRCEHCFCIEIDENDMCYPLRAGKHLKCCKCATLMAEKFVQAWFKILKPGTRKDR